MNNFKSISRRIAVIVGLAFGAFTLSVVAGNTWNAPTAQPPGNNVDAPINVGNVAQKQIGNLGIGGDAGAFNLNVIGSALINSLIVNNATTTKLTTSGFILNDSSKGAGKVLTSDVNGKAKWETPSNSVTPGNPQTPVSPFQSNFVFKRSDAFTGDAVAWCTASHPHVVFCGAVDDSAPSVSSFDGLTVPYNSVPPASRYPCTNDGPCNQTYKNGNGRADLGKSMQYTEIVKDGIRFGCLMYDEGHEHQSYKIDLICSN